MGVQNPRVVKSVPLDQNFSLLEPKYLPSRPLRVVTRISEIRIIVNSLLYLFCMLLDVLMCWYSVC